MEVSSSPYVQEPGRGLGFYTGTDGYLYVDNMRIDDIRAQVGPLLYRHNAHWMPKGCPPLLPVPALPGPSKPLPYTEAAVQIPSCAQDHTF